MKNIYYLDKAVEEIILSKDKELPEKIKLLAEAHERIKTVLQYLKGENDHIWLCNEVFHLIEEKHTLHLPNLLNKWRDRYKIIFEK